MRTDPETPAGEPSAPLRLAAPRRLRSWLQTPLLRLSARLERSPWIAVLAILLVYLPQVLAASRARPLWHDELYTFYIAQAPTLRGMWQLVRDFDLNPPLGYLLTRLSFHLLGVNTLATRLPEMIAFLLALFAFFAFVRRRLGTCFALFAATAVIQSDIMQLASEGRPYGLMFCFFFLALLAWQRLGAAADHAGTHRAGLLAMLCLAMTAMLLSHAFALPLAVVLLTAQASTSWQELRSGRRLDLARWLAMLLPFAVTASYAPMLRNHAASLYPAAFQPDGDAIFAFYIHSIDREIVALCLSALLVLLLFGVRRLRGAGPGHWFLHPAEWVIVVGLMLLPLLLIARLILGHGAFFPRYGAMATWAAALLAAVLLARWTSVNGRPEGSPALLGALVLYLMSGFFLDIPTAIASGALMPTLRNSEPAVPVCDACRRTAALDPTLPLVAASGLTFVEMNHNESEATLRRVFYLTDPVASLEFAHANIFEHMAAVVRSFGLRGHSELLATFALAHRHFFVFGRYDYPEDWLLRKLNAEGATIRVLGRTAGDAYRDNELYEVWLPPAPAPHP